MQYAPRLLDQIVDLTALRDIEMLEFSLLKTLDGSVSPSQLKLLKIDSQRNPLREIDYHDGRCDVLTNHIRIDKDTLTAIDRLDKSGAMNYSADATNGVRTLYCVDKSQSISTYLVMLLENNLSEVDAHMISGLLQVNRNFCQLLEESQTDQLTGLANRKTFEDTIHKVYDLIYPDSAGHPDNRRCSQSPRYWLAMLDIDHFKRVNDNFGHLYGDEVLLIISQIITESFRENDMTFRFGGEEFVVIVNAQTREACDAVLARLQKNIASYDFPKIGQITISTGAVELSKDVFHVTLMDYADQALYHSKDSGRNRVTFFEDMVDAGIAKTESVDEGEIQFF